MVEGFNIIQTQHHIFDNHGYPLCHSDFYIPAPLNESLMQKSFIPVPETSSLCYLSIFSSMTNVVKLNKLKPTLITSSVASLKHNDR